jgi:hypothetical protein
METIYYVSLGIAFAALLHYLWLLAGSAAAFLIRLFDSWSEHRRTKP